ncbi:hypothetical protein ACFVQ4_32295 [Streptomyces laurentii]|uniref:hypothetical protein n=1 Tax=Streptomyces laurentii TaxID=39478 RepID=UPI0036CC70D0
MATPPPPRASGLRRAREWFGGLSEASKVGLVTAVLTTIGGGVFGVVSASLSDGPGGAAAAQSSASGRSETPAGGDTSDSRPGTRETPSTPESGAPTKAAPCEVDSGTLTCTIGKKEVKVYVKRKYNTGWSRELAVDDTIRFLCWGHGDGQPGGGDIWYWTNFKDQDYFGNVPAVDLDLTLAGNPAAGLPVCG